MQRGWGQNGFRIVMRMLTQGVLRHAQVLLRVAALGSGKSGRCSGPETKTEAAKGKINPEFRGILPLSSKQLCHG